MTAKKPGAVRGRPKGSKSGPRTEPTVPIPARAPLWLVSAYRDKFGRGWGQRVVAMMVRDLKRNRGE